MAEIPEHYSLKDRRLERAAHYVSDYWFPVNPNLMQKIRKGLKEGVYEDQTELLVSEIKSDFSLFTHCIKNLIAMLTDSGEDFEDPVNPLRLLEECELSRLKAVLELDSGMLDNHSFEEANDLQLSRFREAMLSASTAEALSDKCSVDSGTAYSAALLRQLGYTLIVWNYPEAYHDAIASLGTGDSLDMVLAKRFGFSPAMLAVKVLTNWGVTPDLCTSLGLVDAEELEEQAIMNAIGSTVGRLCRIGEAFARASDPEHYPSAKNDWEIARVEIEEHLGADGMQIIRDKFEENCESYLTYIPHVFKAGLIGEPPPGQTSFESGDLRERNPFLSLCSPGVQVAITNLYEHLKRSKGTHENLRELVGGVIPVTEYKNGCIYTIDAALMMLLPQFRIGEMKAHHNDPVDYSIVKSDADIVAVAYQCTEPVIEFRKDSKGGLITAVAGMFGSSQRVGVLYLEIEAAVSNDPDSPHIKHFKALRHALNDCLQLG